MARQIGMGQYAKDIGRDGSRREAGHADELAVGYWELSGGTQAV